MKKLLFVLLVLLFSGCAGVPYKDLGLDTTSNFKTPTDGQAGIYVYSWKSGILGAAWDVDFEIKDGPEASLNTGEYCYLDIAPGKYEYKFSGGLFNQYAPVEFEANENYFFRAQIAMASDTIILQRNQEEIDQAKNNILTGRYEVCTKD